MNHGRTRYMKWRCRCDICKLAAREYAQIRRQTYGMAVQGLGRPAAPPGNWCSDAACLGNGKQFVVDPAQLRRREARTTAKAVAAKAICAGCPVLTACRAWSLTDPDPAFEMVAGGLDPIERAAIRRSQTRATA